MEPRNFQQVLAQTFVVVPAYNEGRVIHDVVAKLAAAFANIVVVNDGSSDDTAAVLKGLPVTVVRHHINLGQGAALQTGITFALERGASHIVTFDADGQHRVEDALAALRLLAAGECDVVCVDDGSKDDTGDFALAAGAHVVSHPVNLGQGAAIQTGVEYARTRPGAQVFATFDADGQHRVEDALAALRVRLLLEIVGKAGHDLDRVGRQKFREPGLGGQQQHRQI